MIRPVKPTELLRIIKSYQTADADEEPMEAEKDGDVRAFEDMSQEEQDMVTTLLDEEERFYENELLAVQAVNELGCSENLGKDPKK